MSSKKLKYSNNCNRESGVHFDPPYTTWVITALKIIFRWPPMETAVLRPQKRAHPGVWEKRHTKHPEKRLWLIDVLPMRPQRTDFSLWLRRVQPIREWQNVCIHNGSRWGHLTLRSSLYRFCRCLLYILIPVQSTINQGAQKKKKRSSKDLTKRLEKHKVLEERKGSSPAKFVLSLQWLNFCLCYF